MLCALMLRLKGYRILARDLRTPVGEIDIVARRGRAVAFVEVKARDDLAEASEALTRRQRQRILRAGQWFLQGRPDLAGVDLRFDVMLVRPWRWPEHVAGAWRAGE
jgi:putative endonuclease